MKKTFCDGCGAEMINSGAAREFDEVGVPSTRATVAVAVQHNGCDICPNCVLDAVASVDNRPRPAPEPVTIVKTQLPNGWSLGRHCHRIDETVFYELTEPDGEATLFRSESDPSYRFLSALYDAL